jgi:PAS domain S-box-containing protein
MNVLIADDNTTSCKLLRALLESESHAVIVAADGQEALRLLENYPVDAIISDLLMPNFDGYRFCRAVRQDKRWRDIPFICYTAVDGSLNDEKLAFDLGADAYLRKPSSSAAILNALRDSIDRARVRPGRSNVPHAELDVLNGYSRPLVAMLEDKNFEIKERSRLAELALEVAENISEVFWVTDLANRQVLYVSPAYETIWGRTCKSLLEQPESFFDAIHPEDRPRVINTLRDESGVPYELEYRIVRSDGSARWIRNRAFPVRDAAGMVIRIAGMAEDVTEKRQLEMRLRQSQKMEAIGRLAGGVAHDFNNLLSVIFGHSALLAASPSQERLRDSVAEINGAAERAAALIQQLLAFGRRQVIEPKVLDLGSLLADAESLLRRLLGEDVHLTMTLSPDVSRVNIDPGQINQVLMNLALNARDAMPQGGDLTIEIRDVDFDTTSAAVHPATQTGRYVLMAVTDNGCGMSSEVQARIFEPFFSTKSDSTGLGLCVVDGIVKQNGGHLSLVSQTGRGTTFSIHLPAAEESVDGTSQKTSSKPPCAGNETILLVEDEDPVREVTALLLESLGYHVLPVSCAEEALNFIQGNRAKIDLLLTDVIMPGMGGRELAEAIRVYDPDLKVLFQSGHTDDIVVRNGILNAEVAFLQKPFNINALAKKVRAIFDQK